MQEYSGLKRVVIENIEPVIDEGKHPVKKVRGDTLTVQADIYTDGHDKIYAGLLFKKEDTKNWQEIPMSFLINDRWEGKFRVKEIGYYYFTLKARVDHFRTWKDDLRKKYESGQDIGSEFLIGIKLILKTIESATAEDADKLKKWAKLIEENDASNAVSLALNPELTFLIQKYPDETITTFYEKNLPVFVDREKACFSSWYEFFPRSMGKSPGLHGTFQDCETYIPEIAQMGFDTIYLPPIHPIGFTNRKGKNNTASASPDDPGSPWAIGALEGGHKAINPALGTIEDFKRFVHRANEYGIEVALDLAFQCSMDHPFLKEHPEWFLWRPDGKVQFAENPPKKYEDVVPFNFETEDWKSLWEELKSIVVFWIEKGVSIFRVDNPHTKPFVFWEWLIGEIRKDYPDVILLAEAFTRPKVMYKLAKLGFTQSYTYFTWRNSKSELIQYLTEITKTNIKNYFRPNFWPNTPDILPEFLQYGGRPAFIIRFVLAATLSANYGIYGPAFEVCEAEAIPGKEEYLNSEKYEIKDWDWEKSGNIKNIIARINQIRQENPALQSTEKIQFYETDNEYILFYGKMTQDFSNIIFVVINLDPFHSRSGKIRVPLQELNISPDKPYLLQDLLGDEKYVWMGEWNHIQLTPHIAPAQIFRIHRQLRREVDFDYYM